MNYRNRTGSFVMVFAIFAAHMAGKGFGALAWGLLALQFLLYPHLVYWLARRSDDPMRAELRNLLADSFVFGAWVAALGFPLWITDVLFISTVINMTGFRGPKGFVHATAAMLTGASSAVALFGLHWSPHTDWPATTLAILGLAIYSLMVANGAYTRAILLTDARPRLRRNEQELQTANRTLRQQLQEIHVLQDQLKERANRDALTGLYNRHYLDATIERELLRCKREGRDMGLMLIDIDHFKRINDSHGHQAGDEVLRQLAQLLLEHSRAADIICRYGGEEFLLLLPGMQPAVALSRAENYRAMLEQTVVHFGDQEIKVTLSVGLASYPRDGESSDALIAKADKALYQAKSEGRNRVATLREASALPKPWDQTSNLTPCASGSELE